jgi:uncharacterized membrane protein YozB (DUF420 family)
MHHSRVSPFQRIEMTFFYVVLFAGTAVILWESRDYFLPGRLHGFIMERIDLAVEDWWRYTLITHVAGGLICLVSSLLQYSKILLKRAAWVHRSLGRIYGLSIIMVVFPTGVALAFVAKGGLSGTIGFLFLSFATLFSLLIGMVAIYRKNLRSHQIWISRSFALVTSAITFRVLQLTLAQFNLDYDQIYQGALWGSIAINIGSCEYYLLKTTKQRK